MRKTGGDRWIDRDRKGGGEARHREREWRETRKVGEESRRERHRR